MRRRHLCSSRGERLRGAADALCQHFVARLNRFKMTGKSLSQMPGYGLRSATNISRNVATGRVARRPPQKHAGKKTRKNKVRRMRTHQIRNANQNQNHIEQRLTPLTGKPSSPKILPSSFSTGALLFSAGTQCPREALEPSSASGARPTTTPTFSMRSLRAARLVPSTRCHGSRRS